MKSSSSLSFPSLVPHAPARCAAALFLAATLAVSAFAGSALGTASLTIDITQGETTWSPVLNLTVDQATGTIALPSASGNWQSGFVDVFNSTSKQWEQKSALTWNQPQGLASFSIFAGGNVDPYINYSIFGSNHTGVTQTYSVHYEASVVPAIVPGTYGLFSDVGYSLTPPAGSTIAPTVGSKFQHLSLSTDSGATFFNAGVDVGGAQTNGGMTTALYYDSLSGGGSTLIPINYWAFDTSFDVSANASAAVSGYAVINQLTVIPEPSTYAALMGAVTLIGVTLRRRRPIAA